MQKSMKVQNFKCFIYNFGYKHKEWKHSVSGQSTVFLKENFAVNSSEYLFLWWLVFSIWYLIKST